jgi:hypothetical protein
MARPGSPRALVAELARLAPRFAPAEGAEKCRLLDALATARVGDAGSIARLHEALCFLRAHPDDAEVLGRVEHAIDGFGARVARLGARGRARLHNSGMVGTTLDYPFGLPMARWLASRFPRDVEIEWKGFTETERLKDALALVVSQAEDDAFSEGGLGHRQWLRAARGGRRLSDVQVLVELFDRAALPEDIREWLFESLDLRVRWWLRTGIGSRTLARLPVDRVYFHGGKARKPAASLVREIARPPLRIRRVSSAEAASLIEAARSAMATRERELHVFSHPNPDDILVAEPGRGLRIFLFGLAPGFRLPFEGYYAYFVLKNGVPVSYGGGWSLFDTLEFAVNVFASFRGGESGWLTSQVLRLYAQVSGRRTLFIDPYQLGRDNPEAIKSGAVHFYHRLGFRPCDPKALALFAAEREHMARDPSYRSPAPVLRELADHEMYLTLPGGNPSPQHRVRAAQLAELVTRHVSDQHAGDRSVATRDATHRFARALGASAWRRWAEGERSAFERWALVAALIPDLEAWPARDRQALVELCRAKGSARHGPPSRGRRRHRLRRAFHPRRFRRHPLRAVPGLVGGVRALPDPGRRAQDRLQRRHGGPPGPGGAARRALGRAAAAGRRHRRHCARLPRSRSRGRLRGTARLSAPRRRGIGRSAPALFLARVDRL